MRHDGIYLSTIGSLRARLNARMTAGDFTAAQADALFDASPFQHAEQRAYRENRFWMTSHPTPVDDLGVKDLLRWWGGEFVSMYLQDPGLLAALKTVGAARVIELAVPLAQAGRHRAHSAGEAVLEAFARVLGHSPGSKRFDVRVTEPLGPEAILRLHSEGDDLFDEIGRTYPAGFIDRR